MYPQSPTLLTRLLSHIDYSGGPDACWLWTGCKNQKGYGRFQLGGRGSPTVMAHRIVYEAFTGREIPEGLELDHECEKQSCVNPLHLKAIPGWLNNYYRNHGRAQAVLDVDNEPEIDYSLELQELFGC